MSKTHKKNHIKGSKPVAEFNVSKVRAMSDEEIERRAKNDPDSPIVTHASAKKIRPIKRNSIK